MYATHSQCEITLLWYFKFKHEKNKGKLLIIVKIMNFVLVKIDIVKSICVVLLLLTPG